MTLKKAIASKEGGYEVELHPLEEKEVRAHWAIHDVNIKIPEKPTKEQEHEWLIEHGAEHVKQKRDEWQKAFDAIQPELQAAHDYHQQCVKVWHAHIEEAVSLGANPDTHRLEEYKNAIS